MKKITDEICVQLLDGHIKARSADDDNLIQYNYFC